MDNFIVSSKSFNIIGISGGSCSGKTTVSLNIKSLLEQLPNYRVQIIHMDDFYWDKLEYQHDYDENLQCEIYDIPKSVNWEALIQKIIQLVKENIDFKQLIIVEGVMIFQNEELLNSMKMKYFLSLSCGIMRSRRNSRIYGSPDPLEYFDKYILPNYLLEKSIAETNQAHFIDCDDLTIDQIAEALMSEIDLI